MSRRTRVNDEQDVFEHEEQRPVWSRLSEAKERRTGRCSSTRHTICTAFEGNLGHIEIVVISASDVHFERGFGQVNLRPVEHFGARFENRMESIVGRIFGHMVANYHLLKVNLLQITSTKISPYQE